MAEIDRRRRFAGRLKPLIDVAIEQKNVQGGTSIARLVMILEGWLPTPNRDDSPQEPTPAPDMSGLLQALSKDQQNGKDE